jgi:hypothetical protein
MRLFSILALLLFCHFSSSQELNYQSLIINKLLTEDANAVVRLNETTININDIDEMVVNKKRVVTVLNELGNRSVNAVEYYDDSEKITNLQAIIYDNLGNEITKYKQKDFEDVSAVSGGTLYSDSRVQYLNYTPIKYPYTIEFISETKTKNTGYIPSFYFIDGFQVSAEKCKYTINYNTPELKPIIKEYNFNDSNISKKELNNSIVYEAINIPAVNNEILSPNFRSITPKVVPRLVNFYLEGYTGKIETWNDLGLWMHSNLIKGRDELTESTKSIIHSLVKDADDDLEKARIIYEFVQKNTRYISVQVGIGGMQPISAIDVDRVKYGDCKGLSNYTKALLNEVGVTAYYTHVESGTEKISFETDFPTLAAGDHVILAIPYKNKYYWIDCTSQIHPFGFIGDFTDGRKVLVIKPDGGELVSTEAYINETNYQATKATYSILEDNTIKATIVIKTEGVQYDHHFNLENENSDEINKYYKASWSNINNLNIENFSFINDTENIVFEERVNVSAENYATKSGNRILFAVNPFNKSKYIPKRYRNRSLSFKIERGFADEDEYTIKLPDNYKLEAMPKAENFESEFGSYNVSYDINESENTVVYKKKLLVNEGAYSKDKYNDYRNFRKKIAQMENSKIVLIHK